MRRCGSSPVPAYRCCKMESAYGVSRTLNHSKPGVVDLGLLHLQDAHHTNLRCVRTTSISLCRLGITQISTAIDLQDGCHLLAWMLKTDVARLVTPAVLIAARWWLELWRRAVSRAPTIAEQAVLWAFFRVSRKGATRYRILGPCVRCNGG
jgi:hypothetical protein